MDYKEMLGAAQTVWDNLDKLQKDDPGKYEVSEDNIDDKIIADKQEIVKESLQWNEKVKSQPEPCKCVEIKTKVIKDKINKELILLLTLSRLGYPAT